MGRTRWLSLRQRAGVLCVVPVIYGTMILLGFLIDSASEIFIAFCLLIGGFCIATGLAGIAACYWKNAGGVSMVHLLVTIENVLCMGYSILFFCLLYVHPNVPGKDSAKPRLEHYEARRFASFSLSDENSAGVKFLTHHKPVGFAIASALMAMGVLGCLTVITLGAYKSDLELDSIIEEQRMLIPTLIKTQGTEGKLKQSASDKLVEQHHQEDNEIISDTNELESSAMLA